MNRESLVLFHISDLHFVANMFEKGGANRSNTWGAPSHSIDLAANLAATIAVMRHPSSLLVVTGDVSTDGSIGALSSARRFLDESAIQDPRRSYPLNCLAWPSERRLVLPGNHDRYGGRKLALQSVSREFERAFDIIGNYPIVRLHLPNDIDNLAIAFFVMDSVPTVDLQKEYGRLKFPSLVAAGLVPRRACAQLVKEAYQLDQQGSGVDLDGQQRQLGDRKLVRIVLLHHHPVDDPTAQPSFMGKIKGKLFPETLANSEDFVDACIQAGIDLVLFGHKHKRYFSQVDALPGEKRMVAQARPSVNFLCAPSALQYKTRHPAGFYRIEIRPDKITATALEVVPKKTLFQQVEQLDPIPL